MGSSLRKVQESENELATQRKKSEAADLERALKENTLPPLIHHERLKGFPSIKNTEQQIVLKNRNSQLVLNKHAGIAVFWYTVKGAIYDDSRGKEWDKKKKEYEERTGEEYCWRVRHYRYRPKPILRKGFMTLRSEGSFMGENVEAGESSDQSYSFSVERILFGNYEFMVDPKILIRNYLPWDLSDAFSDELIGEITNFLKDTQKMGTYYQHGFVQAYDMCEFDMRIDLLPTREEARLTFNSILQMGDVDRMTFHKLDASREEYLNCKQQGHFFRFFEIDETEL